LLAVLAHKGDCRSGANAYTAPIVHKSALGGNASDNIFGGQARPSGWRIVGDGEVLPLTGWAVKMTDKVDYDKRGDGFTTRR
jgi:hypothetical protein